MYRNCSASYVNTCRASFRFAVVHTFEENVWSRHRLFSITYYCVALSNISWWLRSYEDMLLRQSRNIFTWRTILPNVIPIWFETTEPLVFLKSVAAISTRTSRTSRSVAIYYQFLIQKYVLDSKSCLHFLDVTNPATITRFSPHVAHHPSFRQGNIHLEIH